MFVVLCHACRNSSVLKCGLSMPPLIAPCFDQFISQRRQGLHVFFQQLFEVMSALWRQNLGSCRLESSSRLSLDPQACPYGAMLSRSESLSAFCACRGHYWLTLYIVKTARASDSCTSMQLQHLRKAWSSPRASRRFCDPDGGRPGKAVETHAFSAFQVRIEGRGSLKPWLRREHEDLFLGLRCLLKGFQRLFEGLLKAF